MNITEIKQAVPVQKGIQYIGVFVTVFGVVSAIVGAYLLYKNNLWKPKVTVISFDFPSATAIVDINGTQQTLYGDDPIAAGGDWGVRLASDMVNNVKQYDRIELIKTGLVHDILYKD